ncbi:MAG: GNAT family N-acetyltransferase [Alphaproteobacteria bacterium]|uniref:GNAT family N-acetyltransferase n=1 Tax=Candidatus Nitrobium versatile TaxID=2884831 RepID=A0A953J5Q0_9BACT|nr:GNAT family N-acetyltransferase [Candidatus Nitrobium versatile]
MPEKIYNVPLRGGWVATVFTEWNFPPRVIGQWNSILEAYGDTRVFISPAWFERWWNAFGEGRELFVVVLEREGEVQAVFPCCITSDSDGEILSSLTNDHTCHFDFIVRPPVRREALAGFLELAGKVKPGLGMSLEYIPVSGCNGEALFSALRRTKTPSHRYSQPWAPRMEVRGEWDAFQKRIPGRLRNTLRRNRKKAEVEGVLSFEVIRRSEQLDQVLDVLFDIEYNSWKGRNGTAIRCSAGTEKFYRELARSAMQSGHLLIFLLKQGEASLAADFCLCSGETVFLLKPCYDEAFSQFTPGNLLHYESFGYLFALQEIRWYDFLGACEPWKMEWTAQTGEYGWIRAFPKSLKGWRNYMLRYGWKSHLRGIRSRLRSTSVGAGYGSALR